MSTHDSGSSGGMDASPPDGNHLYGSCMMVIVIMAVVICVVVAAIILLEAGVL